MKMRFATSKINGVTMALISSDQINYMLTTLDKSNVYNDRLIKFLEELDNQLREDARTAR